MRDNLVQCPKCKDGFLVLSAAESGEVRCAACSESCPVDEGVIDLLPSVSTARSLAQLLMEAEPVVRMFGVHPFSAGELRARCERVGLCDVRFHYAKRLWLIMSAKKARAAGDNRT